MHGRGRVVSSCDEEMEWDGGGRSERSEGRGIGKHGGDTHGDSDIVVLEGLTDEITAGTRDVSVLISV